VPGAGGGAPPPPSPSPSSSSLSTISTTPPSPPRTATAPALPGAHGISRSDSIDMASPPSADSPLSSSEAMPLPFFFFVFISDSEKSSLYSSLTSSSSSSAGSALEILAAPRLRGARVFLAGVSSPAEPSAGAFLGEASWALRRRSYRLALEGKGG
jgi:hypothetical protein